MTPPKGKVKKNPSNVPKIEPNSAVEAKLSADRKPSSVCGRVLLVAAVVGCLAVALGGTGRGVRRASASSARSRERFRMMQDQLAEMGALQDQSIRAPSQTDGASISDGPAHGSVPQPKGTHHAPLPRLSPRDPAASMGGGVGSGAPARDASKRSQKQRARERAEKIIKLVVGENAAAFGGAGSVVDEVSGVRVASYDGLDWRGEEVVAYISARIFVRGAGNGGAAAAHNVTIASVDGRSRHYLVSHSGVAQTTVTTRDGPFAPAVVASVNIWNYNLFESRLELLRRAVAGADIIGVQEVRGKLRLRPGRRARHRFQATSLSALLPDFDYVFQPAQMFVEQAQGPHHTVHEGVAVMSRYPIRATHVLRLTLDRADPSDYHQRIALHAEIESPSGLLHFITTHLSLSERARRRTLKEIADYVGGLDGPVVVTGDFNNPIGSDHALDPSFILAEAGLKDAYGDTESRQAFTFPSWDPIKRIDAVYTRGVSVDGVGMAGRDPERCVGTASPVGGCCRRTGVPEQQRMRLFASDHTFPTATIRIATAARKPGAA